MNLQAVIVCVDYADFFKHTGAENQKIFNKVVVVTDIKDTEVTKLCLQFGYTCVKTDVFYENGATFNKYAGINEGLKYIDSDAWVLFLDSDIALPKETRRVLEKLDLDPTCLYGMDRINITGYDAWTRFKKGNGILNNNWMLTTDSKELGARLVHIYGQQGENGRFEGWRPLGYFQLCYRSAFHLYPQESKSADHCDLVFSRLWPREKRVFIPEIFCIHLETQNGELSGVNWYGRKSPKFEPITIYKERVTKTPYAKPSLWKRLLTSFGLAKTAA